MSWAACDRLANAAEVLGLDDRADLWRERAAAIRERIEKSAWHEGEQRFAATFGGDEIDASLLQLIDMRFLAADDERFRNTFNAVEKGLRRGDHMLRYARDPEERRGGNGCVSTCKSRVSPQH